MARGLDLAIALAAFMLALTVLSGVGLYGQMNLEYNAGVQEDIDQMDENLSSVSATDRGGGVFQGFTIGPSNSLSALWLAITNTKALLMMFGAPATIAGPAQTFARLLFGISIAMFIRGVAL